MVFDAAIVGAGPAGSATARWLALQGWRVALVERTRFESPRIGESLPPNVQGPLRELGLWSEFLALEPLPSWGTSSVWGEVAARSHSHMLSPYGCGWHVDRRAFDQVLAGGASVAGASLFEGMTVRRSVYQEGYWWLQIEPNQVQAEGPGQILPARVLIDATGRRAQAARSLGAQRLLFDRLVGVAVRSANVDLAQRGYLLVEAADVGWWYSAPLPLGTEPDHDSVITMLMTDADLCGRLRLPLVESWKASLQSTVVTRQRLHAAHHTSTPQVNCAHSQRLRRDVADNTGPWLAAGDAALAVDPVSGSGVMRALLTGRAAANTVNEILTQPETWREALAAYEAERDKECTDYLIERAQYYAAEQRFDTPFWRRRRVL
jgi:flavin-dependent dehydrogenase